MFSISRSRCLNIKLNQDGLTKLYVVCKIITFSLMYWLKYSLIEMWFTACGQGNFGLNCTSPCHCLQGASCDHVSGNCPGDQCASGWTTSNCSVGKILNFRLVSDKWSSICLLSCVHKTTFYNDVLCNARYSFQILINSNCFHINSTVIFWVRLS